MWISLPRVWGEGLSALNSPRPYENCNRGLAVHVKPRLSEDKVNKQTKMLTCCYLVVIRGSERSVGRENQQKDKNHSFEQK